MHSALILDMTSELAAALLAIMDKKHHWAYPALTRPGLTRAQLLAHFQHEYLVYVRDFPVLLARVLAETPPLDDVRKSLAENIYEEQTGGLSSSAPHPELFLRMMEGLGFSRTSFDESVSETLHPAAREYRSWLREMASRSPWQAAAALLTIFVEGSVNERAELEGKHHRPKGDAAITGHSLVVHYGCPPSAMQLVRAHGDVEGSHRHDAWNIVLSYTSPADRQAVIGVCSEALSRWQKYRDGVAERMNLSRKVA